MDPHKSDTMNQQPPPAHNISSVPPTHPSQYPPQAVLSMPQAPTGYVPRPAHMAPNIPKPQNPGGLQMKPQNDKINIQNDKPNYSIIANKPATPPNHPNIPQNVPKPQQMPSLNPIGQSVGMKSNMTPQYPQYQHMQARPNQHSFQAAQHNVPMSIPANQPHMSQFMQQAQKNQMQQQNLQPKVDAQKGPTPPVPGLISINEQSTPNAAPKAPSIQQFPQSTMPPVMKSSSEKPNNSSEIKNISNNQNVPAQQPPADEKQNRPQPSSDTKVNLPSVQTKPIIPLVQSQDQSTGQPKVSQNQDEQVVDSQKSVNNIQADKSTDSLNKIIPKVSDVNNKSSKNGEDQLKNNIKPIDNAIITKQEDNKKMDDIVNKNVKGEEKDLKSPIKISAPSSELKPAANSLSNVPSIQSSNKQDSAQNKFKSSANVSKPAVVQNQTIAPKSSLPPANKFPAKVASPIQKVADKISPANNVENTASAFKSDSNAKVESEKTVASPVIRQDTLKPDISKAEPAKMDEMQGSKKLKPSPSPQRKKRVLNEPKVQKNEPDEKDDSSEIKSTPQRRKREAPETLSEGERKSKRMRTPAPLYQSPAFEASLKIPKALSVTPSKASEKLVCFFRNEFVALRNAEGTFYICQLAQNVYKSTRTIKIRWLSPHEESVTCEIFTPDYYDTTDFECILTTVKLERNADKKTLRLPPDERLRILNILQRALDKEKGIDPEKEDLDEDHPDGLDISLYKDEAQLKKKKQAGKRKSRKDLNDDFSDDDESVDEELLKELEEDMEKMDTDEDNNIDDDKDSEKSEEIEKKVAPTSKDRSSKKVEPEKKVKPAPKPKPAKKEPEKKAVAPKTKQKAKPAVAKETPKKAEKKNVSKKESEPAKTPQSTAKKSRAPPKTATPKQPTAPTKPEKEPASRGRATRSDVKTLTKTPAPAASSKTAKRKSSRK